MARVKRAVNAHKKRRTTLERASGYRGQRSRLYRKAKEQVTHSLVYSYNDRRKNKGNFRRLWIQRINAAARAQGMTYNRFIQGLNLAGVEVDRKILADLAVNDPPAFTVLVETARQALPEDVNAPSRQLTRGDLRADPAAPDQGGNEPGQGGPEARPPRGPDRAAAVPGRRSAGRRGGAGPARLRRRGLRHARPPASSTPTCATARPGWTPVDDARARVAHRHRAPAGRWWPSAASWTGRSPHCS